MVFDILGLMGPSRLLEINPDFMDCRAHNSGPIRCSIEGKSYVGGLSGDKGLSEST